MNGKRRVRFQAPKDPDKSATQGRVRFIQE